ncbi:transposase [Rhodopirellula sp. SWK7]|uniref:transposase n=1 Tax=Rhodopirellula sp. SWK7 TaxID=595460 RepID=UPI0002BE9A13|nr:transposase [Rhodopirellula sp. SWK7]EMI40361.1 transposase IS204/IS1001/IS1096/IS1165 family protein [Rhodopirellula sp. SWK7]
MSILDTKWDQTWNIVARTMRRGKQRKQVAAMPRIRIDEKAFKKGHSYITLLYDLDNSTVEAITMDRSAAYVKATETVDKFDTANTKS